MFLFINTQNGEAYQTVDKLLDEEEVQDINNGILELYRLNKYGIFECCQHVNEHNWEPEWFRVKNYAPIGE